MLIYTERGWVTLYGDKAIYHNVRDVPQGEPVPA